MVKKQKKRGRPQTNEPEYPLQAEKMKQAFAFLTTTQGVTKQSEMAPFFGVTDAGHLNRLFLGHRQMTANHKEFCFLKTRVRTNWWDQKDIPIEQAVDPAPRNRIISGWHDQETGKNYIREISYPPDQEPLPTEVVPVIPDRRTSPTERRKSGHMTGAQLPIEQQTDIQSLLTHLDTLQETITTVKKDILTSQVQRKSRKEKDTP